MKTLTTINELLKVSTFLKEWNGQKHGMILGEDNIQIDTTNANLKNEKHNAKINMPILKQLKRFDYNAWLEIMNNNIIQITYKHWILDLRLLTKYSEITCTNLKTGESHLFLTGKKETRKMLLNVKDNAIVPVLEELIKYGGRDQVETGYKIDWTKSILRNK